MPRVPDSDIRLLASLDGPYVQSVSYRVRHEGDDRPLRPGEMPAEPEWVTVGTVEFLEDGGFLASAFGVPGREFGDVVQAARWLVDRS